MEKTLSEQIKDYAKANPLATEREVREHFKVSRQLVSQMFHAVYSKEELAENKKARLNEHVDIILERLKSKSTFVSICEELNISKSKLNRIIESNPNLLEVAKSNEEDEVNRVRNISNDWLNNFSLRDLGLKYNLGESQKSVSSYISKLRTRHGEEMFPLRLDNSESLESKHLKYNQLVTEGKSKEEIASILGYKTVMSMKQSIGSFTRKSNG